VKRAAQKWQAWQLDRASANGDAFTIAVTILRMQFLE